MGETISVAMPVFNRADWIGQTLEHILNQSVPVNEIVLCDDGSTDDLELALAPFRDHIKLVRIKNSGPAAARKVAIEHTSGDWVALCDSDDFWGPRHIQHFVDALQDHPDMDFYFSNFKPSDNPEHTKFDQAPTDWLEDLCPNEGKNSKFHLRCKTSFLGPLLDFQASFPSCQVFRRDLYDQIGGIKGYVSRWRSEDFHVTARMAAVARGVVGTRPDVVINKHADNFSKEYVLNLQGEVDILEDIVNRALVPDASRQAICSRIDGYYLRLFRAYYWNRQYREAITARRKLPKAGLDFRDVIRVIVSTVSVRLGLG